MFNWLIDWISSFGAAMVFFSFMVLGAAFTAFSFLLGGIGDHDVDHEIGHDLGGHDVDHGADGDGHGNHDGAHDTDSGIGGTIAGVTMSMLSVRGGVLVMTGFGAGGFVTQISTGRVVFSTVVGLIVGYAVAFPVMLIVRTLKNQQSNSLVDMNEAVGQLGVVMTSIPQDAAGEVSFTVSGRQMSMMAVSKNGQSIRSGTNVRVDQVAGGTITVSPL